MSVHKSMVRVRWVGVLAVAASLVLTSCSGEGDSALTVAQANVTKAEAALEDAQTAATDAQAGFCDASSGYITALDRYGDVLHQTAVTVGDVQTAGADLKDPSQETQDAADEVVSTREALHTAQQDLADAQAALAAVEASASSGAPPAPEATPVPSPTPLLPDATVARVKQAETDFATAQDGITKDTPLVQASEQFNAAVVALEMSWIQLFAQSGCLTDEAQVEAAASISAYTLALQQQLAAAGYYTGQGDGLYGPQTVAAVVALQAANDLPQTGTVDKATEAALRAQLEAAGGAAASASLVSTAALQQTLKLAGYWDGPIDGLWSPELTAALGAAQEALGVPVTGAVDAATLAAFQAALAEAQAEPEPEPTPEESATEG